MYAVFREFELLKQNSVFDKIHEDLRCHGVLWSNVMVESNTILTCLIITLDQMVQMMKRWKGVYNYSITGDQTITKLQKQNYKNNYKNYSITGDHDRNYDDVQVALMLWVEWIFKALETKNSTSLQRSAGKQGSASLNIHPNSKVLNMGLTRRSN